MRLPGSLWVRATPFPSLFVLLRVGVTSCMVAHTGRGLLPHGFTLTSFRRRYSFCGPIRPIKVTPYGPPFFKEHPTLWSPDFPPLFKRGDRPNPALKFIILKDFLKFFKLLREDKFLKEFFQCYLFHFFNINNNTISQKFS